MITHFVDKYLGSAKTLNNKSILIKGGTASFDNHFVEYILKIYKPKKIVIYSRDEYKQFVMSKKCRGYEEQNEIIPAINEAKKLGIKIIGSE